MAYPGTPGVPEWRPTRISVSGGGGLATKLKSQIEIPDLYTSSWCLGRYLSEEFAEDAVVGRLVWSKSFRDFSGLRVTAQAPLQFTSSRRDAFDTSSWCQMRYPEEEFAYEVVAGSPAQKAFCCI